MKLSLTLILVFAFGAHLFAQKPAPVLKVGDQAPVFSLPDLNNKYIFLRDYSGEKLRKPWKNKTKYAVVVSFFATWCAPCKKEIPYLEQLKEKYGNKDIKFFLVDVGEERAKINKFLQKNPVKLTVLHDRYQQTAEKYGATSLPRLVVIDKDGTIRLIKKGFKDGKSFLKEMRGLIDKILI